jgi:hypothetical protein
MQSGLPSAISIDNYIDAHRDKPELVHLGKLAIAKSILEAERRSHLRITPETGEIHIQSQQVLGSWYVKFLRLLTENRTAKEVAARLGSITLIVFNYDRCVEHYLRAAFMSYYHIQSAEAEDLVRKITIIHPYGSVGDLPWQNSEASLSYGKLPQGTELQSAANALTTFSETQQQDPNKVDHIQTLMEQATTLVFLGFAYHKINMKLLFRDRVGDVPHKPAVYGTGFGISVPGIKTIEDTLINMTHSARENIHIDSSVSCSRLFDEYWHSLSFA